ncbi:MAG: helix-turn-helix domain-containing protein [Clostridia bacterium]|nr:helix-turn-helix domain-containing protein [Clostridia bacterium]
MKQQSEICRARSLFMTKGILNREILPSEIVYSWVRSKLHNISFEILDKNVSEKKVNILALKKNCSIIIKRLRQYKNDYHQIYLIDMDGYILYKSESLLTQLPNIINFKEEVIGTTAAGITLITKIDAEVFGCEHFNQELTNYLSGSILIDGEIDESQVILLVLSPISRLLEHNQLKKALIDDFRKEEEEANKVAKNDENIPVNTVNRDENRFKTTSDKKEIFEDKHSVFNDCKLFTLSVIEKKTIEEALKYYNWNMRQAAIALGIGRSTLYRKIKEYDIQQ